MTATSLTPDQLAMGVKKAMEAEKALRAIGITDPAELQPLVQFAAAAEQHQDALKQYRRIKRAHAAFAARHDGDDPGHDEHQRNLAVAQAALVAAEQLLLERRQALNAARGLGTFAGETGAKQ